MNNTIPTRHYDLEKDIRYTLFNRFLLVVIFLAGIIMVVNLFNKRPIVNVITSIVIILLCAVWLILSKRMQKYHLARISFMAVMTFLYIPFGYWTSPGSYSAMMYLTLFTVFFLSFTALNTWEYCFPVFVCIEAVIMLHTEIWFPDHYYVYTDSTYRILDLSINFTIVSSAVILIIRYVMKQYSTHSTDLYLASITDSLTGLYNRRYFTEFIHAEYNRATRTGQHFSMILLDLNHFKKINDNYGHMTGDKVLIAISEIIKKCLRSYDIAARYGGDEFVIILPATEKDDALIFMQRLEVEFDKYCSQYKKEHFAVAYGIEDSKDKSLDDLYRETDNNLYTKKAELKEKNGI